MKEKEKIYINIFKLINDCFWMLYTLVVCLLFKLKLRVSDKKKKEGKKKSDL